MTTFVPPKAPKNIRTFTGLSALALLLGTGSVLANPASGQGKPDSADHGRHPGSGMGARLFERWDKDNDGRVAIAGLPARMKANIATIDQNKDGILTRDEFDKGKVQLKALRDKRLDRNGDGKVTAEERREDMRTRLAERFGEQDKNHDGFVMESEVPKPQWAHMKAADANSDSRLTLNELKTALDAGKLRPSHPGARGPRSEAEMKAHAQERFSAEDKNKDGFLVEAEIPKQKWEHVKAADANRDNRISFDELTAAIKAGKTGPRGPHRAPGHEGQGRGK